MLARSHKFTSKTQKRIWVQVTPGRNDSKPGKKEIKTRSRQEGEEFGVINVINISLKKKIDKHTADSNNEILESYHRWRLHQIQQVATYINKPQTADKWE